jgi:hypothetical protein
VNPAHPAQRVAHRVWSDQEVARSEPTNYRIARPYEVDGETPKLRILTGVQAVAARLIETLAALPDAVTADSLRLDPGVFEVELGTNLP